MGRTGFVTAVGIRIGNGIGNGVGNSISVCIGIGIGVATVAVVVATVGHAAAKGAAANTDSADINATAADVACLEGAPGANHIVGSCRRHRCCRRTVVAEGAKRSTATTSTVLAAKGIVVAGAV